MSSKNAVESSKKAPNFGVFLYFWAFTCPADVKLAGHFFGLAFSWFNLKLKNWKWLHSKAQKKLKIKVWFLFFELEVVLLTSRSSRFPACVRQHAWHSYRAGCIVISGNPQGLVTPSVQVGVTQCLCDLLPRLIYRSFLDCILATFIEWSGKTVESQTFNLASSGGSSPNCRLF